MRCGKERRLNTQHKYNRRNPHECAVAKNTLLVRFQDIYVATRTNALWQRNVRALTGESAGVATRTNALWQSRAIVVPEPEAPKTRITVFIFSFSASNTRCDFLYDSTAFETFQHLYSKNRRIKTVRCGGVFF